LKTFAVFIASSAKIYTLRIYKHDPTVNRFETSELFARVSTCPARSGKSLRIGVLA
jgi:hypothetical protein